MARGLWGGLVVLGQAPVAGGGSRLLKAQGAARCDECEYGGTLEDDDSGVLRNVRVWQGGGERARACV